MISIADKNTVENLSRFQSFFAQLQDSDVSSLRKKKEQNKAWDNVILSALDVPANLRFRGW